MTEGKRNGGQTPFMNFSADRLLEQFKIHKWGQTPDYNLI